MTTPKKSVRGRALVTTALAAAVAFGAPAAFAGEAETPFTSIVVFGDSYADRGNATNFAINGPGAGWPRSAPHPFHTLVPFTYQLQQLYGLPNSVALDYAVAGATSTGHLNPAWNAYGYQDQVAAFLSLGRPLGRSDLIAQHIGGNDGVASVVFFGSTGPAAEASGRATADTILASFGQLVDVGARNVAVVGSGDPSLKPIGLPGGPLAGFQAGFNRFYEGLFDQLHRGYGEYADSGVRVFFFELRILEQRLIDTPQMYGYTSINQFFLPDGLHPTPEGSTLLARYVQNQMEAPGTVAAQGDVTEALSIGFTGALLARLATRRVTLGSDASSASGLSAWLEADFASGDRDAQFYSRGFEYESLGVSAGLEFQTDWGVVLGVAVSTATGDANLNGGTGDYDVESLQFGAYASLVRSNWFADAAIGYGRHDFALKRPGIIDTIAGDTDADAFSLQAEVGYLFDAGAIRIGPVAGLRYLDTNIDGYAEIGDALVTQIVDEQSVDSFTGSLGVQLRMPAAEAGVTPYLNLTLDHDFDGTGRTIITTQATTPLIHVQTPIEDRESTYGRVAMGLSARLNADMAAFIDASATFARDDGDDAAVHAGVWLRF